MIKYEEKIPKPEEYNYISESVGWVQEKNIS